MACLRSYDMTRPGNRKGNLDCFIQRLFGSWYIGGIWDDIQGQIHGDTNPAVSPTMLSELEASVTSRLSTSLHTTIIPSTNL